MAVTDRWVETPRGRLFLRDWAGDDGRAPVILMHDSLGSVDLWRDFPQALAVATGRRVIAYDRLGFGRSDPYPGAPDVPGFIAAEASVDFPLVLRALGLDRFALLGHSVGGAMGLEIAARWTGQCEALITISAQTFAEPRTLVGIRATQADFADRARMQPLARYHGDKADWVLRAWTGSWLSPPSQIGHWTVPSRASVARRWPFTGPMTTMAAPPIPTGSPPSPAARSACACFPAKAISPIAANPTPSSPR